MQIRDRSGSWAELSQAELSREELWRERAPAVSHLHIEILREQIFLKVPASRALSSLSFRPLIPSSVSPSDTTSSFFLDLHTRLRMMLFTVRHVSPNSSLYSLPLEPSAVFRPSNAAHSSLKRNDWRYRATWRGFLNWRWLGGHFIFRFSDEIKDKSQRFNVALPYRLSNKRDNVKIEN